MLLGKLRLTFPKNDGPDALLLVNRLDAVEELSRDFCFTLELISDSVHIELKEVQGRLMTVELVREDGTLRYFNGYVFEFSLCAPMAGKLITGPYCDPGWPT